VLTLPPAVRIFVAVEATDMRKQFDGLVALVRDGMREDPYAGHLYAFANRRRDRIKLLYFDRSGFWLCAKRLESGTFAWPTAAAAGRPVEWRAADLALLLSGVDPARVTRRKWWAREPAAETSAK
jgi:transposase